jgi:hypothetical protein
MLTPATHERLIAFGPTGMAKALGKASHPDCRATAIAPKSRFVDLIGPHYTAAIRRS